MTQLQERTLRESFPHDRGTEAADQWQQAHQSLNIARQALETWEHIVQLRKDGIFTSSPLSDADVARRIEWWKARIELFRNYIADLDEAKDTRHPDGWGHPKTFGALGTYPR